MFLTGENGLDWKISYNMVLHWRYKKAIPEEFIYGYAIIWWKVQGSEWDNVLVIEEGFPWDKEEHKKFIYICATRAAKCLVIIRKD